MRTAVVSTWRVAMSSSRRMGTLSGHVCSARTSALDMESCNTRAAPRLSAASTPQCASELLHGLQL